QFEGIEATYLFAGDANFEGCTFSRCGFYVCDFPLATFSNCAFEKVAFRECTGPVTFLGCSFRECDWIDVNAAARPAWTFVDCTFDIGCRVIQSVEVIPQDTLS